MGKVRTYPEITESKFEGMIKKLARLNGWLYYHTYRSLKSPAGFPDCVMVRPPRLIFAELKTKKGRLSPDQENWLKTLEKINDFRDTDLPGKVDVEVYLWRPDDWEEIEEVLKREDL